MKENQNKKTLTKITLNDINMILKSKSDIIKILFYLKSYYNTIKKQELRGQGTPASISMYDFTELIRGLEEELK